MPHSPLCSFSCSLRCFLKLKDLPQLGSEHVKVFWWTCWYFLWCWCAERREVGDGRMRLEGAQRLSPPHA